MKSKEGQVRQVIKDLIIMKLSMWTTTGWEAIIDKFTQRIVDIYDNGTESKNTNS